MSSRLAVALSLLLLAGCAVPETPPAPSSPSKVTPSPTPTATPAAPAPLRVTAPPAPRAAPPLPPPCATPCAVAVMENPWQEFEPDVAVDPTDPRHVIVAIDNDPRAHSPYYVADPVTGTGLVDGPDSGLITVRVSRDGGATWTGAGLPHLLSAPATSGWARYCNFGDPQAFFGPDGTAYVMGFAGACSSDLHVDNEMTALFFARSADGGATWSEPSTVWQAPAPVQFQDKPWADVDPATGKIAIAWTGFTAGFVADQELYVSLSTDGGASWSRPPHTVMRSSPAAPFVPVPAWVGDVPNFETALAWGAPGVLHVAHAGSCGKTPCVQMSTSSDDGATWSTTRIADVIPAPRDGARALSNAYPSLAVDRSDGRLFVAYPTAASGDYDVLLSWSDDAGASWTAPVRLEDDAPGNGADQAMQGLAAQDGIVHAVFLDRRADPTNLQWTATYARYDPRNGTLLNVPLETPWSSDPGGTGSAWFGDYNTASVAGRAVALSWTRVTPPKQGEPGAEDLDVYAAVLAVTP